MYCKTSEKYQLQLSSKRCEWFFLLLITVIVKWCESSIKSSTHKMTEAHHPVHIYTQFLVFCVVFVTLYSTYHSQHEPITRSSCANSLSFSQTNSHKWQTTQRKGWRSFLHGFEHLKETRNMHEPVLWEKFPHFQVPHPTFMLSRNLISSMLLLFAQIWTSFTFIIASLTSCNVSHTKRP